MPDLHDRQPFPLRDRNGRILFSDPASQSLGDTMVAYVDHLDEVSRTNGNLSVHREVMRELAEVMHAHRGDFALAMHAVELEDRIAGLPPEDPTPGGLRGVVARARRTAAEREAGRRRAALMANYESLSGVRPDAESVIYAEGRMDNLRTTLYAQAMIMRSRDIARELGSNPAWVTNTLGERPADPELQKVWNRTAHQIAARRADMRITEAESPGLPANQHELLTTITNARVELGLDDPAVVTEQELGLAIS
ncbi:MAG TPA: hypothetical protein VL994_02640 [Steroidobacteraceae bacterium]|nr:hypothetical protein [Steroidobacteraceae bacterium]